jgi:membrane protein DedA with SNARE-associated domain
VAQGLAAMTGADGIEILVAHGYAMLFGFVLAEQIGVPIPAVPALLTVGALSATGRMSLVLAFAAVLGASLPADLAWYELGRRRGRSVLGLVCRISLEPDSCVRRTENLFTRSGRKALLIAKFFPGLSAIASPLAGMIGVGRGAFIALDSAGAILWSGTWMALGYVFSDALALVASIASDLGHYVFLVAGAALASYVGLKFVQRHRLLRSLRMARITPDELKRRLEAGDENLVVIDTRAVLDVHSEPYTIRGARWIAAEEIERRHQEIPRDREIVLYCT